jgi:hypothetical protein
MTTAQLYEALEQMDNEDAAEPPQDAQSDHAQSRRERPDKRRQQRKEGQN